MKRRKGNAGPHHTHPDISYVQGSDPLHPALRDLPPMLPTPPSASAAKQNEDPASATPSTVLEPNRGSNLHVTSPASTLALTLMYLKTNDQAIASLFTVPGTHYELDLVRPDNILLRVLGRALVMWDDVEPRMEWVQRQLPPLLLKRPLGKLLELAASGAGSVDWQAVAHAQMHAIAGEHCVRMSCHPSLAIATSPHSTALPNLALLGTPWALAHPAACTVSQSLVPLHQPPFIL
jgi:hypothetical protein